MTADNVWLTDSAFKHKFAAFSMSSVSATSDVCYRVSRLFVTVDSFVNQVVRFLIVGGLNTAVTLLLYWYLLHLRFHYQLSLILTYVAGVLFGYFLNRHWTFAGMEKPASSLLRYSMTYVGLYFVNMVLLSVIVELHWLDPAWGQLVAIAAVSVISFLVQKYWVFNGK